MATVVITRNEAIEQAVADALRHLPLESLVRGKVVAVKPNETWASAEDTTGVTQPDTLRAVLQAVKQFQPRQLVVSGGFGAAATTGGLSVSRMMEVIEQGGGEIFLPNPPTFQ